MEKITVTIETDSITMLKIKRLLAWLHIMGRWGHSGRVAIALDGDGDEQVTINGIDISEHTDYLNTLRSFTMSVEYINSADSNCEET